MEKLAFQEVIQAVEALSLDEQEILLDIIQKRLHNQQSTELVQEIA